jgi:hypothetical protein
MQKISHHPTPTLIILDGGEKTMGCNHNQTKQKNMSSDRQNYIKIVILLDIF